MPDALLIIDYVHDFVADGGRLTCGQPGQAIDSYIATTVGKFFARGQMVVTIGDKHDTHDSFNKENKIFPLHCCDDAGRALYGKTAMAVAQGPDSLRLHLDKQRYSAFCGTSLDLKLKERGIRRLHLTGVCTDICILHTAIDAYNLGYDIVVHRQGVASFNSTGHDASLAHISGILGAEMV